jgi:hypothetical protein
VAVYGDELRLMRAQAATKPGGVTLNMLWSPMQAPQTDYTVSVILFDAAGRVLTNADSRPLNGLSLTPTWEAGGLYYDTRFLAGDLEPGRYELGVQVYSFVDASVSEIELLTTDDCTDDPDCHFAIVDSVEVAS